MTENGNAKPAGTGGFIGGLDRAERIVLGCCALVAVLCFLPWYSVDLPKEIGC